MPVAKLLGAGTPDAMRSDQGTDSFDTFIRQAVGKETLYSFSRTGDNSLQWIQLLNNLDQPVLSLYPDLPGWPLLAPMKIQMQKCDKCAREFCSPINFRRHVRVHRRSMKFPKDPQKHRDLLGMFWDKLSYDEAKEIMSFQDVNLEEVPGSSIIGNIAANLRKPIFLSLPQVYVNAGSALVDIVQDRPSRLPISSKELFSVLDDASEKTFLCAGTAESLKKYVFDGEAGKIGLEMKNLIACASFLVEQKLVKAWIADKDAEALRCQKLLVEEEEAAQKRQAELFERKRRRKIRQKEQKAKDHSNGMKADIYTASDIAEISSRPISPEVDPKVPDEYVVAPIDPIQVSSNEEVIDIEAQRHSDFAANEQQKMQVNGSHHFIGRWQVPKSQRGGHNGFHSNQNGNFVKWEQPHKHRDQRVNSGKIWTKKPKSENGGGEIVKSRVVHNDAIDRTTQNFCQLMIGSISVTVRNRTGQHQVNNSQARFQENAEVKTESVKHGKFWRARHDTKSQLAERSINQTVEEDVIISERGIDQSLTTESRHQSCNSNGNDSEGTNDSNVQVEDGDKSDGKSFSIDAAKAFLAQRWKEAISGEHVKLVVTPAEAEPPGKLDDLQASSESSEQAVVAVGPIRQLGNENVKPKFRRKPDKSIKTKYIPKQRPV